MGKRKGHETYGYHELPRGGFYVPTSDKEKPIQVGMPPETIKDSMALGLCVPQTFVLHDDQEMFDDVTGLNGAEFEFPM